MIAAISSEKRLLVLDWLKDPRRHFPAQVAGDLVKDGVCGVNIAAKLKVTQPTVCRHLKILADAGLLKTKRVKQWTFYRRDEKNISLLKRHVRESL
jgi:ArsR family transcriptional regulator